MPIWLSRNQLLVIVTPAPSPITIPAPPKKPTAAGDPGESPPEKHPKAQVLAMGVAPDLDAGRRDESVGLMSVPSGPSEGGVETGGSRS